MATAASIHFRKVPGQSKLFLDYVDSNPAALQFYDHPPTLRAVEEFARRKPENLQRGDLSAILRRQNTLLGADSAAIDNIGELEKPGTVAVVTGQQVGLFGGPLYTVYKALAAIRLAEELRARGVRAVPVFWMECEDHDIAEVTRSTVLDRDSSLHKFEFADLFFGDRAGLPRPVGSLVFPESIREAVDRYSSFMPDGPHKSGICAHLNLIYQPGAGLADAFGRRMTTLLGGRGLVLFNPSDPAAKRLAAPVFRKALLGAREIHKALSRRSGAVVDSGFHAQVGIPEHSTTLFIIENGERRSLLRQGDRFGLKNSETAFDRDGLLQLLDNTPEVFSPNVLLRPLIQDHLFPTVAYVGGPAETAYFAQIAVMYPLFGNVQPVIWPRSSFTLIESVLALSMKAAGISLEDCFAGARRIAEKLIESEPQARHGARLRALGEEIEGTLAAVRPAMIAADSSLGPALETAQRKIMHHVETLQARFVHLETTGNAALSRRADAIFNACYPNGVLQEREFGIHHFLALYGTGLLDTIYRQINLGEFVHRVITLE